MRSVRDERGQAAVSYGGILALLGLVFVALFALGLDGRVARAVEGAVCVVTGGSNCERPDGTTAGAEEPHEDSGRADREVYDADCDNSLPGDRVREGDDGPTGDGEADAAWDNLGRTYDHYRDTFGRDSYDDSGAELIATVHFCETPGEQFNNAYWNGDQMVFGEGYAAPLDVTAHELTHAITDRTADLVYECQSGALNESFSDIFASNVDTGDWEIGEDLPGGAIRDMSDPGPLRRPRACRRLRHPAQRRRPGQRPRRRALELRDPQPRLLPDRAEHRPQGRRAGHVPRAHRGAGAGLGLRGLAHGVAGGRPRPVRRGRLAVRADRPVVRGRGPRRDLGRAGGAGMLRRLRDSRVVFGTMRTGALIAGVIATLALAGCGGEDESPADPARGVVRSSPAR